MVLVALATAIALSYPGSLLVSYLQDYYKKCAAGDSHDHGYGKCDVCHVEIPNGTNKTVFIEAVDVNGDGLKDIILANRLYRTDNYQMGGLAVLMNDGKNGNFQNAVEIFIFQPFFTRDDIGSIHFVDMNGDGLDDIFIGTSSDFDNNKIFLNSGDGIFQDTINASKDFGPAYVFLLINKGNG